ncbi:MAG: signal recognition particle-docking protein FtsY [Cyanobacteria bacterium P01_H01_bin.119]
MTGFNWFSRQHGNDDASQTPADAKSQRSPETQQTDEGSTATPQMTPEEYLQWAKTAYQTIQKRQQADAQVKASSATEAAPASPLAETELAEIELAETESTETEISETDKPEVAALQDSGAAESDATKAVETAEAQDASLEPSGAVSANAPDDNVAALERQPADSASKPQSAAEASVAVDSSAEATAASAEEASSEMHQPAEALPFWAKAEAERQARLERLQETAIAEPEPEPEPAAATALAEPAIPEEVLDEAFLWSAEVLAAQGRRAEDISIEEITWLKRLRQGLDKTRRSLINQLKAIVGQGPLNEEAVFEIEALLLQADVGVEATDYIIETLQARLREETLPPEEAIAYLKSILRDLLDSPLQGEHNLTFTPEKEQLSIWMMTGVNGAGKTTTIGKLAHVATKSGYNCLIAAADTFRAAAVEQVKVWGQRSNVDVIANPGQNTDPAAVVYDAISAATSRDIELLLVDTAGRLQNKKNLMDELSKVRRIINKKAPEAKVEALLVLDATLGQNGLRQAQVFAEAAQLSGVVLTKLDGTARGGIALAVVQQLGLPIRFIGAGEGIEDLRPFSSFEFVEALLSG